MATARRFVFGTQTCTSVTDAGGADREWLLTDGTGGYASGTVAGLRTRRQHGLLVTPAGGAGLLALDPVLTLPSGARVELAVHEWATAALAPRGHRLLESFELVDGLPRWRWRIGDVVLERELAMAHGRPELAAVHRLVAAPGPVRLALGALVRLSSSPPVVDQVADGVVVEQAVRVAGPGWQPAGEWWFGASTRRDGAREDLWHAGSFGAVLSAGDLLEVSAWAGTLASQPAPAQAVVAAARRRARRIVLAAAPTDDVAAQLALAADHHIITGPEVVECYPGGDADDGPGGLIGYEGLFLETGRVTEGRALLRGYPERLPTGTADARRPAGPARVPAHELWYVHAVERHVTRTGDADLAAEVRPVLDRIVDRVADPADGLLTDGPGKPVVTNALWVNALGAVTHLHALTGAEQDDTATRYDAARSGFLKRYPTPDGWLFDLLDLPAPEYPLAGSLPYDDPVLRPEQLLGWSLPYAPLTGRDVASVDVVGAALLTPLGLRSLAPSEYGYRGRAAEDPDLRQGTAYPWLIGAYVAACRATGRPVRGLLDGLVAHLGEYGLGSVSELADGDAPYSAGGAPFHACSVAEVARAYRGNPQ